MGDPMVDPTADLIRQATLIRNGEKVEGLTTLL
jgi:hypothetical protein